MSAIIFTTTGSDRPRCQYPAPSERRAQIKEPKDTKRTYSVQGLPAARAASDSPDETPQPVQELLENAVLPLSQRLDAWGFREQNSCYHSQNGRLHLQKSSMPGAFSSRKFRRAQARHQDPA